MWGEPLRFQTLLFAQSPGRESSSTSLSPLSNLLFFGTFMGTFNVIIHIVNHMNSSTINQDHMWNSNLKKNYLEKLSHVYIVPASTLRCMGWLEKGRFWRLSPAPVVYCSERTVVGFIDVWWWRAIFPPVDEPPSKDTVQKSPTNATSVTMHTLRQEIWKHTVGKSQIDLKYKWLVN